MTIPTRMIGYGAYNLCFDRWLGKPPAGGPILFQALRNGNWPVNLVKVICFRNSAIEGLPATRRVTLYDNHKVINTSFIDNLSNLVDQARQFGFWVEVCIFNFHSMLENPAGSGVFPECPEFVPDLLNPAMIGGNTCDRTRGFFNIGDQARLNEQIKLVRALGDRLRVYDNVLWEIANEVRIQGCSAADIAVGNCKLVAWLNKMSSELVRSLQGRPHTIGTSTGLNERVTFQRQRPVDGCNEPAFLAEFFDFHSGQWGATADYVNGIVGAKQHATSYNSAAPLIINDDGVAPAARTPDKVKAWAKEAFKNRLHYASKQEYPPGQPLDTATLDKLREANNEHPL
jgi:hypothetical protein